MATHFPRLDKWNRGPLPGTPAWGESPGFVDDFGFRVGRWNEDDQLAYQLHALPIGF